MLFFFNTSSLFPSFPPSPPLQSDGGKSTFVTTISNAFGNLIGSVDASSLTVEAGSVRGKDAAACLRWALIQRYKRLVFCNECRPDAKIDGNLMKRLGSGGDRLQGRFHGGNEIEFR